MKSRDLPLDPETQTRFDNLVENLKLVTYADPSAFDKIETTVKAEMKRAEAALMPTTPDEQAIRAMSATSLRRDTTEVVRLRMAVDARTVAEIPEDKLAILRVMHGDNDQKIARAWRKTQWMIKEGKLSA